MTSVMRWIGMGTLLLCSCTEERSAMLIVDVRTDYVPVLEFVRLQNVVIDHEETSREVVVGADLDFIEGQRAAEIEMPARSGTLMLETRLIDRDGTVIASKRTAFSATGQVSITVVLARTCSVDGCSEPCITDTQCPAAADCVTGVCLDGSCFQVPRETACADDEWCSIASGGCTPVRGSMPPPVPATAFRITRMDLVDPHLYAQVAPGYCICADGTSMINSRLDDQTASYDRSTVLVFRPLDLASSNDLAIHTSANCDETAGGPPACRPSSEPPAMTRASHVLADGAACVTREFDERYAVPEQPSPPCFVSDTTTLAFEIEDTPLPLTDVQATGTWAGDPPDGVMRGLLFAFLSEDDARTAVLPPIAELCGESLSVYSLLEGGGSCNGGDDRDDRDRDGSVDGWWWTFTFEAVRATWSTP